MSDQPLQSGDQPIQNGEQPIKSSVARRVAIVAAAVAVPMGGVHLYLKAQTSADARDRALEKGMQYDLTKLMAVDPALIKYKEVGKIDTGLIAPRSIALDPTGNLLVAGNKMIRKMGTGGGVLGDIKLPESAVCIAVDEAGVIYVSLKNRVEVYAADGTKKAAWPSLPNEAYITGIAARGEDVYLGDSGRRMVLHTDRAGKILNEIGRPDAGRGLEGILMPSPHLEISIAADDSLWLNNTGRHRMENFTKEGRLERFWGISGNTLEAFPGCCNPTDFVLLPDGSFITAEKGIARVKHYLADGRFDCVIAAPSSFGGNVVGLDVVVDAGGRVLVLERGTSLIHIFAPLGGKDAQP